MPTDAKILTTLIKKFFIKTILYKCITALESADADQHVLYICSMKILLLIFKKIAIGIFELEEKRGVQIWGAKFNGRRESVPLEPR